MTNVSLVAWKREYDEHKRLYQGTPYESEFECTVLNVLNKLI